MDEMDLEILRLKAQLEAVRVLLRGVYTLLANSSSAAARGFRDQFEKLQQEHQKIALQKVDPAISDLMAAEYQEALSDLISFIQEGFHA